MVVFFLQEHIFVLKHKNENCNQVVDELGHWGAFFITMSVQLEQFATIKVIYFNDEGFGETW